MLNIYQKLQNLKEHFTWSLLIRFCLLVCVLQSNSILKGRQEKLGEHVATVKKQWLVVVSRSPP